MLVVVITLGILIAIATGALITGLFLKSGKSDKAEAPAVETADAAQPGKPLSMSLADGYRILGTETQPGRLILHVRSNTEDEIYIISLDDGHMIARVHTQAPQ